MEIFEANAEQIAQLSSTQLVQLMKRLLHAECALAEIPLRAVSVPVQITVADGGEDGRVDWMGGSDATDYFPSRFCIFQSKAQNLTPAMVRAEVLDRASRPKSKAKGKKKGKKRRTASGKLNAAILEVLSRRGSYVIFCSKSFTGQKIKDLKNTLTGAIRAAGGKPARAAAIDVYDGNRIAAWVNAHPPVAMWLAGIQRQRALRGFMSHEHWSRAPEIHEVPWVADDKARFLSVSAVIDEAEGGEPGRNIWTFDRAAEAVLTHLERDKSVVRIAGPSGFGKSRFAFEVFNKRVQLSDEVNRSKLVYADYDIATDDVGKLAVEIADKGAPAILVVDDCPDDVHAKLAAIARRLGSRIRLVTIDVETKVVNADDTLVLRLEPAADETITSIAHSAAPKLTDSDTRFIRELARGFPRMAVLAAQQGGVGKRTIRSAEQLLDRIIWGRRDKQPDAQRALELLSLFDWVGISGPVVDQANAIAEALGQMSRQSFVEHIKTFRTRGIVAVRGDFARITLIPLAASLGARRLSMLSSDDLMTFFKKAPNPLKASLLRRLRWVDFTPEAGALARKLLAKDVLGNLEALNTDFGADCLDRLVHIDPDAAMSTIEKVFNPLTREELAAVRGGRRHLVWALEKLVFRKETFEPAATLLRWLAAAENETGIANNATGQFTQLYQMYLSGTEATPDARVRVLDEGLNTSSDREREVCVEALGKMLNTVHFSRGGGAEEIGSGEHLIDWAPRTVEDIRDFLRAGIQRLITVANGDFAIAVRAKELLGSHIRGLLSVLPADEVKALIVSITVKHGIWIEALQGLNEWLYFDRSKAPADKGRAVRQLFDELMPTDPVELVMLYTHGWAVDFHDPDTDYDPEDRSRMDFEYASRRSVELASVVSANPEVLQAVISGLATSDAKTPFAFARRISELSENPVGLFTLALRTAERIEGPANIRFFAGLIAGADARDPIAARECIRSALRSEKLKHQAISLIGAGKLQASDINLVISLLKAGDIAPAQCGPLSYGRAMEHLSAVEVAPLLEELSRHGSDGLWAALDITGMLLHGGATLEPPVVAVLRSVLVDSALFQGALSTMDGHHLEGVTKALVQKGLIDSKFALALAKQLLSICTELVPDEVFRSVDDSAKSTLRHLIKANPEAVWKAFVPLLTSKNWRVRHRLEDLIEPTAHRDHLGAGLLHELPENIYLTWARKDPGRRAAIVAKWLPVATKEGTDSLVWHPDLVKFVDEFADQEDVLRTIGMRLHPRTWWGSLANHLGPYIALLKSWLDHDKPEVRRWARSRIETLQREIEDARKREEEDEVRMS